jgi:hypothetical protein
MKKALPGGFWRHPCRQLRLVPHRGGIGAHPAMAERPSKACRQAGLVPQKGQHLFDEFS